MSRYVIEIKPEYEDSFKGLMLLGAKDSNLFVDTVAVEDLEELNSDYINEHFSDLQDTAYQKGFEDGNAQENRGCEGCRYEPMNIEQNPCHVCQKAYLNHYNPKTMDDKIKVGDEVFNIPTQTKGILIEPETEHLLATVIVPSSRWRTINIRHANLKKTGKHYDIEKLLEAMKE